MLKLKSCPRCRGDVLVDRDHYGWYEQCIQCGYESYFENTAQAQEERLEQEKELARSH